MTKILFFFKRYWIPETFSIAGAYLFAWVTALVYNNHILTSYAGAAGAFLGFYLVIYFAELKKLRKKGIGSGKWIDTKVLKDLLIEFGISEFLDVLLIRPFCLFLAQELLNSFFWSMLSGNLVANIFFFLISGIMYTRKDTILKLRLL